MYNVLMKRNIKVLIKPKNKSNKKRKDIKINIVLNLKVIQC